MDKHIHASSDWIRNWQESIAVKITSAVLYAVVLAGFAFAVFSLRNVEEALERNYSEKADGFAYQIATALNNGPALRLQDVAALIRQKLPLPGFSAVEVALDGQEAVLGERTEGAVAVTRRISLVRQGEQERQHTLRLKIYHPPLRALTIARRNALFIMTGATTLIFGFFLTRVILAFITRPIQALVNATKAVAQGDLTVRLDTGRRDEFGALSRFFNHMLDQIAKEFAERRQAEERLQRYAEELKESNEELKSFVYSASHDLRTPLVNVKGFSGELYHSLKDIGPLLNACAAHLDKKEQIRLRSVLENDIPTALGFIDSSVDMMDGLINAMLKLSRCGRRELRPETINMETLLRSLLQSMVHLIEQRNATVTIGPFPEVIADRTSLEQIMSNLLDNAVKYLKPDRPGKVEVTAERNQRATVFHIHDNGRGIAQDDLRKIFEIFRRVGEQDVPGEGMGLTYVKTLVKRHGGRIWCESEPEVGSAFHFTIPLSPEIPG